MEGSSCQLASQIKDDAFDLIVCEGGHEPRNWASTEVWPGPLRWITSTTQAIHLRDPLPLCLTPSNCPWRPAGTDDCFWRSAALRTLERAGRPHRIVSSANAMEGLYAPVMAGEAVTVSFGGHLPAGLRVVGQEEGLPPLPDTRVVIMKCRNAAQPHTNALAQTIMSTFTLD